MVTHHRSGTGHPGGLKRHQRVVTGGDFVGKVWLTVHPDGGATQFLGEGLRVRVLEQREVGLGGTGF